MPAIDETWAALIGAFIGAVAGLGAAWLTSARQERAEHTKWLREQMQQAYSNALKSLAKSTVIPIGNDLGELEAWFDGLAEVRESLVLLQVYSVKAHSRIEHVSQRLFQTISENDFALVATQIATIEGNVSPSSGFVAWGVAQIRTKINEALIEVTDSARLDLGKVIKS